MTTFATPDAAERAVLYDIVAHAFALDVDRVKVWLEELGGIENLRVLKGDRVLGGLLEVPMGQFFGGRSVPMLGVAGVAISAQERGRGFGAKLMVEMLRDAKRRGFALSTLYPASVTLYRRAGYERAGAKFHFTLDPRHVDVPRVRDVDIREVATVRGLPDELHALYTQTSRFTNGFLDRGPYVRARVTHPRGLVTKTFTAAHDGKLEGYVVLGHSMPGGSFPTRVDVKDFVATTPRAATAMLRLLVEYRSLADTVTWVGAPNELLANLLPERHVDIALPDYFMVRIVDVVRAFALRGWPRRAESFTLELDDASLPEVSGRYAVTREGVTPGGLAGPVVKVNERALAALYTGFSSARTLAQAGWLDANEDAFAILDAWFAGPMPTMRDMF